MRTFDINNLPLMCELLEKEIKRLKIPKQFKPPKPETVFTHDFSMYLSIRQDSGKTTNTLLFCLCEYYLWGWRAVLLRNDNNQTKKASTETLFDVIKKYNYIEIATHGEYNDIILKPLLKKWFLVYRDKENDDVITREAKTPFLTMLSNENYLDIKSTYNDPYCNTIIFDEFMDTKRDSRGLMNELENNISTILRLRPESHVIMLGNNLNQYFRLFEEFTIEDQIINLKYGSVIDYTTELGTTVYAELLDISEEKKLDLANKRIRFSGFNTPKMAVFNGVQPWQGGSYKHITDFEMLDNYEPTRDRIYIKHRNRFVKLEIYENDKYGTYVFLHWAKEPKLKDSVILTEEPQAPNQFYGSGTRTRSKRINEVLTIIMNMHRDNQWYYENNRIGELIADYFKSIRC